LFAFLFIAPFLWVFSASVRNYAEATSLPPKWLPPPPSAWNLKYVKTLFANQAKFFIWMKNSLLISSLIALGMVLHAAIAGYAYARLEFKGKNLMFGLLLIAMMIPIQVTIVPLYRIMTYLHLINTQWAVTVPGLFGAMCPGLAGGFGIFLLRQFYATVPKEMEEAATIDGATPAYTFFRIILPMAKASLASLAIIAFTFSWNDYFTAFIMINSPERLTLPVGILQLRQPFATGDNVVFTAITFSILPVLLLFLFFQKWIVKSMINIGIKG
jgi:multiple sugar transport system permease protein